MSAEASAVKKARKDGGEPSGEIGMPTLTLHTAADPLVAVQNQSLLRDASGSTQDLAQLFTVAPDTFPAKPGAPYGAGHCNFTPDSRVGMIDLLDQWVRGGQAPSEAAVTEAFGADSGFDPTVRARPLAELSGVRPPVVGHYRPGPSCRPSARCSPARTSGVQPRPPSLP